MISKLRVLFIYVLLLSASSCKMDDGDFSMFIEFGAKQKEYTVNASAGHINIDVLSNQTTQVTFLDETPWAFVNKSILINDEGFFVDYDDNAGFPRMTRLLLTALESQKTDTVYLRQQGGVTPYMTFPTSSLIVKGSTAGAGEIEFRTNIDFEEIEVATTYTSNDEGNWINDVTYVGGNLKVDFNSNPAQQALRSATVKLTYTNGWGKKESTELYVLQRTATDALGTDVTFEDVRDIADFGVDKSITDYIIITGYVVSSKESHNAGDNHMTTETTTDHTVCDKTFYLQSEDGKYGFSIETATVNDNIFNRYDKVRLLLAGTKITAYNEPDRFMISGVTSAMVVDRTSGSASSIPVKEKYMSELTDNDIYTFVTLKDCEFPVRKGSLTPIHEGYTLGDGQGRLNKYPRLMRDINGSSMYLYTNTTCPYRRDGKRLPYGSGKISGVVVHERYTQFSYNDDADEEFYGNIGRYQLRHMAYEDIKFAAEESFSKILTEYRYINNKATDGTDGYVYWYPTLGANGRFTHSCKSNTSGAYAATTWNYLGPIGTSKGVEPFKNNKGSANGLGIILENGTDYLAGDSKINTDGKGQDMATNSWATTYWWDDNAAKPEAWRVEFSTKGIVTDNISMQISVQGGRAMVNCSPINWKAEWSTTGDLNRDGDWNYIDSYTVPDFPVWAGQKFWHSPSFKQIDIQLPLEILDRDKVYIRFTPRDNVANSEATYGGGIYLSGANSGSAMDYFAIRYNKK